MAEFKNGNSYTTVWMKEKTKKVFKGDNKGDEYQVLQGSLDVGGGKMMTFEVYADLQMIDVKGEDMLPLKIRKWKGKPKNSNGTKKPAW